MSARSQLTPASAALPLPLALPTSHKRLVPVETPLSQDGELSARHAQHRTAEQFEAIVHDTTWLLSHALSGKRSSGSGIPRRGADAAGHGGLESSAHDGDLACGHAHSGSTTSGGAAGEFYLTSKTQRLVSAQAQRAFAFFRLQRFARAVKDYDACLASEPTSALLYYNRGCALYAWGKKERAIQDFTRALKLDCKNALYVESRAAVSKELGRFQEAIQDYTWLETLRRMAQHTRRGHSSRHDAHGGDGHPPSDRNPTVHASGAHAPTTTDDDPVSEPREALATMRGSFSMTFSELQATLMGASLGGDERPRDTSSRGATLATDGLTTEERETQVLEWMVRFLQRSPRSRKRADVREAVQHARGWSFFRGMDAAMVEQCLEDAEYARYDSDAVVVAQRQHARHFHVVLSPTAPFVKNIDAQSGISKLRELKKLSQGDAVGTDAYAVSFGDGTLRTIRREIEAAAAAAQSLDASKARLRRGHLASTVPRRHSSLHTLLASHSMVSMLTQSTATATTADAGDGLSLSLLPPEPASFTSLEPVHCLLLEVEAYLDILHDHEERVLDERVAFLRGCRVFQSCSEDVLTALAAVSGARVYDPGKDLLRTGDEVSQLSIIKRGVCQVRKTIRVPAHQASANAKKARKATPLSPLRRGRGHGHGEEHDPRDDAALASARSTGDGSWVLDNGWMLTNPRLVNNAQGDGKEVPMVVQDVNVGILASGQVFGELSVLQPGQSSQVTIHSQTLVEILVFQQSDLARLQVQYHSGPMNALQESLLFHNPPQQKIVQLQRDLAHWEKHKRGVLGELALQLPTKAQSVLRGATCMKPPTAVRKPVTATALSPLTRPKDISSSASLPGLHRK